MSKIAIVRLRGGINVKTPIKDTMTMLKLFRKNYCVVIEDTPSYRGMLQKIKDYVTFGEISDETYNAMVEKRGEKDQDGNLKKFFRLHPPKGGFERKGIKVPFSVGGALGDRKDKINELIAKML
jgi:large subunit ribosomal protein L30